MTVISREFLGAGNVLLRLDWLAGHGGFEPANVDFTKAL
jgi:hypothetical protein